MSRSNYTKLELHEANTLTGANQTAFSTNHLADTNKQVQGLATNEINENAAHTYTPARRG